MKEIKIRHRTVPCPKTSDVISHSNNVYLTDALNSIYNYINDFCDALINSAEITVGIGAGYGLSLEAGDTSLEGLLYINPINVSASINSSKIYSSVYFGGNIEFLGFETGPELHYIFDWTTMSFVNLSEESIRFADFEIGGAYYKGFGGIVKLTIE